MKIGVREGSPAKAKAEAAGIPAVPVAEAAQWADVIMILAPDTAQAAIFKNDIEPHLGPGKTLMFAHGFNIRFGTIQPPPTVDVSMIAPKAPGHRVREVFVEGGGVPALVAIHAVMIVVLAITYVLFRISPLVERALGHIGIVVLTRLFGILLAALSVQFVLDGLRDYGLVPG